MLDDQDGQMVRPQRPQQLRKPELLLAAKARGRLVEDEQGGIGGQRTRDLQDTLIAERQIACELERLFTEPDALELHQRFMPRAGFLPLVEAESAGEQAGTRAGVG